MYICVSLCVNLLFPITIMMMMMTTIKMSRYNLCNKEIALNIQMSLI